MGESGPGYWMVAPLYLGPYHQCTWGLKRVTIMEIFTNKEVEILEGAIILGALKELLL